ncbi:MAG TPA: succinate dehydrogenase, cytochrome b556 subunit [Geminicoccus sp.]|uniref:succinate dehydrogenase, cytochrome b556 subunit n=1 Tax=Geminicoccus sp. TaxID=2024832 RepID=UPI002E336711|nr:succinate dehydrogenase, cytochrome b556 subunit [Geminicoccus sp.]HEX2526028.1 succinate dehydrogenase, cytochrome b556 subunit [Geminicoccus sp.]
MQPSRPISPHLQIYRWYASMIMSIMNRATGLALTVAVIGLAVWLLCLASGPRAFAAVQSFLGSWFGILVLFGFTIVWAYHMLNGIRHLAWDAGYGFHPKEFRRTGIAVLIGTAATTVLVWLAVLIVA